LKKYAIIVAGGSGQRMQSTLPKQFLLLQGKPVLYHTLAAFQQADSEIELILVLPEEQFGFWENLVQHLPVIQHRLVAGGRTRFHSSQNALLTISGDGIVAIHDGVRPLIEPALIRQGFQAAKEKGNAVFAVGSKDSVRLWSADKQRYEPVAREAVRLIQTPQIFEVALAKTAYEKAYADHFTDDASVVESLHIHINLVEGSYQNIKITTPEDLVLAEILLK
jgi:2-C-methyl-D-erythritol 4-phosphate cytidylyltransferase